MANYTRYGANGGGAYRPASNQKTKPFSTKKIGIVGAAATAVVATGIFAGIVWDGTAQSHILERVGGSQLFGGSVCEDTPKVVHVQLLDRTDRALATADQTRALINEFKDKVSTKIGIGDRIQFSELTTSEYAPIKAIWEGCNPGSGKQVNPFFSTPPQAESEFQKFKDAAVSQLRRRFIPMESPERTPLIAGITEAYRVTRERYPEAKIEISVYSDLLEHTSLASAYVSDRNSRSVLGQGENHPIFSIEDMPETSITLHMIHRANKRSRKGKPLAQLQNEMANLLSKVFARVTGETVAVKKIT